MLLSPTSAAHSPSHHKTKRPARITCLSLSNAQTVSLTPSRNTDRSSRTIEPTSGTAARTTHVAITGSVKARRVATFSRWSPRVQSHTSSPAATREPNTGDLRCPECNTGARIRETNPHHHAGILRRHICRNPDCGNSFFSVTAGDVAELFRHRPAKNPIDIEECPSDRR